MKPLDLAIRQQTRQISRQTAAIDALAASIAALAESNMLLVEALARQEEEDAALDRQTLDSD